MAPGSCDHTVQERHHQHVRDNDVDPVLEADDGATVEFETMDAWGGPLDAFSTAADLAAVEFARANPVTGPVFVQGAGPNPSSAITVPRIMRGGTPRPCTHAMGSWASHPEYGFCADTC